MSESYQKDNNISSVLQHLCDIGNILSPHEESNVRLRNPHTDALPLYFCYKEHYYVKSLID